MKRKGYIRLGDVKPDEIFIVTDKCEKCKKEMIEALKLIAAGKRKLEAMTK